MARQLRFEYPGAVHHIMARGDVCDALPRRASFSVTTGGPAFGVGYTYDGASRLATVVSVADTSTYGYLADSSLIGGLTTTRGGVTSLAITSGFDKKERLTAISSSKGTSVVSALAYAHNDLNQRVESVLEENFHLTSIAHR